MTRRARGHRKTARLTAALGLSAPAVPAIGPPTGLSATQDGEDVDLAWTAPVGETVLGYRIERRVGAGSWSDLVADTGTTAVTYTDTTSTWTNSYEYRISTITAAGTSAPTAPASVTVALPVPTGLTATRDGADIDLAWTAPVGGPTVTGYLIERNVDGGGWATLVADTGNTNVVYTDTAPTPGSTYEYRVSAISAAGTSGPSNVDSDSIPLAAPTGLTATLDGLDIDLAWTAPATPPAITGYLIERNVDAGGWTTLVADTGTTAVAYTDTAPTPGSTYEYRVSAITASGTSGPSNTDSAAVPLPVPTGLTATFNDPNVDLAWSAPSPPPTVTGYRIERRVAAGSWGDLVADTGTTAVTYQDTTAAAGTTYEYRVSAISSLGTSGPSNVDSVAIPSGVPANFEDFRDAVVGSGLPADWTIVEWYFNPQSLDGDIVSDVGAPSGKGLSFGASGFTLGAMTWDDATPFADGDLVMLVKVPTYSSGWRSGPVFRFDGMDPPTLAMVNMDNQNNQVTFPYHTNNDSQSGTWHTAQGLAQATNEWWWVRVNFRGNAYKVRYWLDGDPEPPTWDVETTNGAPTQAAGAVGIAGGVAAGDPYVIGAIGFTTDARVLAPTDENHSGGGDPDPVLGETYQMTSLGVSTETIPYPSVKSGTIYMAVFKNGGTINTPAGWTLVDSNLSATNADWALFSYNMTGSEGASFSYNPGGAQQWKASWVQVLETHTLDAHASLDSSFSSGTHAYPTVASAEGRYILLFGYHSAQDQVGHWPANVDSVFADAGVAPGTFIGAMESQGATADPGSVDAGGSGYYIALVLALSVDFQHQAPDAA